jgi:hypothetical protein
MGTSNITVYSGEISSETAIKTILQLVAPSTCDLLVEEFRVSGKAAPSSTSHTAALWTIAKQTTAGTPGESNTITPVVWGGSTSATDVGSCQRGPTAAAWSVEPTLSDAYLHLETPTTAPGYTWRGAILIPAGTRLGVLITSANNITCMAELVYRRA